MRPYFDARLCTARWRGGEDDRDFSRLLLLLLVIGRPYLSIDGGDTEALRRETFVGGGDAERDGDADADEDRSRFRFLLLFLPFFFFFSFFSFFFSRFLCFLSFFSNSTSEYILFILRGFLRMSWRRFSSFFLMASSGSSRTRASRSTTENKRVKLVSTTLHEATGGTIRN